MKKLKKIISSLDFIYLGIFIIPFQFLMMDKVFIAILLSISGIGLLPFFKKKTIFLFTDFTLGYLILILYGVVSCYYTQDTSSTYAIIIQIVPYYLYCIILSWHILCEKENRYKKIILVMKIFFIASIIVSCIALMGDLKDFNQYTRIGSGLFKEQYTMFSYYLMTSIGIGIWLYSEEDIKQYKMIWGVCICYLYIIAIFTAIRKAIFVPIVFLIAYIFIRSANKKKVVNGLIKIIILISLFVVSYQIFMQNEYFASTVGRRMNGLILGIQGKNGADNSFNIRELLVESAWKCFGNYPLLGYGFGAFRDYADKMIGIRLYAHNNFLELLASDGIVGFTIYYGTVLGLLYKSLKLFTKYKNGIHAFGGAFIIALLVNDFAVVSYLSINYMAILSIIACALKFEKEYIKN